MSHEIYDAQRHDTAGDWGSDVIHDIDNTLIGLARVTDNGDRHESWKGTSAEALGFAEYAAARAMAQLL